MLSFDCEKQTSDNQFVRELDDFSHILNGVNSFLIIGNKSSGKIYLIKDIIKSYIENNMVDDIFLFTNQNTQYNNIVTNTENIYQITNEQELDKYLEKLMSIRNDTNKNILVVFDEVLCNPKSKNFKNFILNCRHLKISCILSIPYPFSFSPEIRCNFDYVLCFKDNIISNTKRLYEHYFGVLPKYKHFHETINQLDDYACMVVNQENTNNKLLTYKSKFNTFNTKIAVSKMP